MVSMLVAYAVIAGAAHNPAMGEPAKVAVPLGCAVERGRLAVKPTPERLHPIIGGKSSHAFTTCAAGKEPRCRTFIVHKFDLSCDGYRVSWLGLVGGALEQDDARVRVVANRFTLRMPPGWNSGRVTAGANEPDIVAFPVGFAPALKIPVRFVGVAEPHPTVTAEDEPAPVKLVRVAAGPKVATTPAPITIAATTNDVVADAPGATEVSSWLTTVEPVAKALGTSRERFVALAAVVTAAWLVLFAVRRRFVMPGSLSLVDGKRALAAPPDGDFHPEPANDTGPRATASEGDTYAAHCARMIADAVALHKTTNDALPGIANDALRAVLREDLDKVQAVLLAPSLANDIARGLWASVEISVTGALANLDRIGRIIDGVGTSDAAAIPKRPSSLPETAADAYDLLGVRPDASPVAVKKIVDGLRLSWHPDHAKDEIDRSIREARLKQINVAWDLIQGRQKAA